MKEDEIPKISFEAYYQKEILPELPDLETERKKLKIKLMLPLAFVLSVGASLIYFRAFLNLNSILVMITGIVSLYGLYKNFKNKITREFRIEYKTLVVKKIVEYIDKEFRYSAYGRISKKDFETCGIFPFAPDRYRGDDLVSGIHEEETEFSFSEVYAQRYVRDHRRRRHIVPLFKGLLFKADFNKNFKFVTVVRPDISEKYLGKIGQSIQEQNIVRGELIKLESPDFEKEFSVYSDDQVEARYLLSPKLMERILAYKQKHDERISLSFANSHLYIAIPRIEDMFEPNFFKPLESFPIIEKFYEDMKMAVEIVEDLDLNTRVWSKQPKVKKEERRDNHIGGRGYHGRGMFR